MGDQPGTAPASTLNSDPSKKPENKLVYLPPGKTADMSQWNKTDVIRWMTYFLPVESHPKPFEEFRRIPIDGDVLKMMLRFKPSHMTFKISKEEMDLIMGYAQAVLDSETLHVKQEEPFYDVE